MKSTAATLCRKCQRHIALREDANAAVVVDTEYKRIDFWKWITICWWLQFTPVPPPSPWTIWPQLQNASRHKAHSNAQQWHIEVAENDDQLVYNITKQLETLERTNTASYRKTYASTASLNVFSDLPQQAKDHCNCLLSYHYLHLISNAF